MVDHEQYMRIALEEAERGAAEGNVAVGSVLVDGHSVVARGRNLVMSTSDPCLLYTSPSPRDRG